MPPFDTDKVFSKGRSVYGQAQVKVLSQKFKYQIQSPKGKRTGADRTLFQPTTHNFSNLTCQSSVKWRLDPIDSKSSSSYSLLYNVVFSFSSSVKFIVQFVWRLGPGRRSLVAEKIITVATISVGPRSPSLQHGLTLDALKTYKMKYLLRDNCWKVIILADSGHWGSRHLFTWGICL